METLILPTYFDFVQKHVHNKIQKSVKSGYQNFIKEYSRTGVSKETHVQVADNIVYQTSFLQKFAKLFPYFDLILIRQWKVG